MSNWFRSTPESERLLSEERFVLSATEILCEALDRRGMSRKQLADLLGVTASEVTQRLSGKRNMSMRTFAGMLHVMDFAARDFRLRDLKAASPSFKLVSRDVDWPSSGSYTTSTGVTLRSIDGLVAS